MTNTFLTSDIILKEALLQFENELVITKLCNRDYEQEFDKPLKRGEQVRIRRPVRGQVRTGAVMQTQDISEGRTALAIAGQIGADIEVSSRDLTLSVDDFGKRILRPQMIPLANTVDLAVMTELYTRCPNWVGTPGQIVNSFQDYALGPQRLDELSVPKGEWAGILSPADYWGTLGSVTALSGNAPVKSALEQAKLGFYAGTNVYQSQNVKAHTVGTWGASPTVDGANQNVTYASVKDTTYLSQTLNVKALTSTTGTCKKGDVFTIDGVYAVNPVTGEAQDFLRQFTVISDATADGSGLAALTISPAIIISGPYKTCSAAPADSAAITKKGTASTAYKQNLVFHPDAVTLAVPPMEKPEAAAVCEMQTYKGITMRLVKGYDMVNDKSQWRFDLLYAVLATQPHLATRLSGT